MSQRSFCLLRGRLPALLAAIAVLLAAATGALPAAAFQAAVDPYADVQPELQEAVAGELSTYLIEAALDEVAGTITGTMDITFWNDTETDLDEVYFRLYPNAPYYGDGALDVTAVTVDGLPATTALEVEDTALRVDLTQPLAPGQVVDLTLSFTTTVPVDAMGSYGIFRRSSASGTWMLAGWHPVLAVYEDGRGWHIDPPTPAGDPTHAASALYDVTFTAPAAFSVVASGLPVSDEVADNARTERFVAGPAREFTIVVDDDYIVLQEEVNGVVVSVYTEPDTSTAVAEEILAIAERTLAVYGERFGPYPYVDLDLVETRLEGALAVSWSGIIFLDGPGLLDRMATVNPVGFETVVAHEIAHLWWGAVVGSNSNDHTFINEGLATLSSIIYLEETAGAEAAAAARESWVLQPARALLQRGDAVADMPVAEVVDTTAWSWAVYGKGALGFMAIRREIGDDAFFAALRSYAETFQYDIATPADLLAAFEAASGQDLADLWSHWFNEAAMTAEEIASFAE